MLDLSRQQTFHDAGSSLNQSAKFETSQGRRGVVKTPFIVNMSELCMEDLSCHELVQERLSFQETCPSVQAWLIHMPLIHHDTLSSCRSRSFVDAYMPLFRHLASIPVARSIA
jgi:hypothetical protein